MYECTSFLYDGVSNSEMEVILCRIENSSNEDLFVSNRELKLEVMRSNSRFKGTNYFFGEQRQPQKFKVELYIRDLTDSKLRDIVRYFYKGKFCEFVIDEDIYRAYYCMPSGDSKVGRYGSQGYVSFEMLCMDEFSYGAKKAQPLNATTNDLGTVYFVCDNYGDVPIYPKIQFTIVNNNNLICVNHGVTQTGTIGILINGNRYNFSVTYNALHTEQELRQDVATAISTRINAIAGGYTSSVFSLFEYPIVCFHSTTIATSSLTFDVGTTGAVLSKNAVAFINQSKANEYILFSTDDLGNNLVATETITVDCNRDEVLTNQLGLYRYSNMKGNFLELVKGKNNIQMIGKATGSFNFQPKYLI